MTLLKHILLPVFSFFLLSNICHAQTDTDKGIDIADLNNQLQQRYEDACRTIKADFADFTAEEIYNLMPFMKKGKTKEDNRFGFYDIRDGQIKIEAKYNDRNYFFYEPFHPFTIIALPGHPIKVEVSKAGKGVDVSPYEEAETPYDRDCPVSANIKGFTLDKEGEVESISNKYYTIVSDRPVFGCPWYGDHFSLKKKYYLIVRLKNRSYGIIDTKGKVLKGFDFIYEHISFIEGASTADEAWFLVSKKENGTRQRFFVSSKGEVRKPDNIENLSANYGLFGYAVVSTPDEKWGLFDIPNLRWITAPQQNLRMLNMTFSAKEELDTKDAKNREKAKVYIYVYDHESYEHYYIDVDGKKYRPNE